MKKGILRRKPHRFAERARRSRMVSGRRVEPSERDQAVTVAGVELDGSRERGDRLVGATELDACLGERSLRSADPLHFGVVGRVR